MPSPFQKKKTEDTISFADFNIKLSSNSPTRSSTFSKSAENPRFIIPLSRWTSTFLISVFQRVPGVRDNLIFCRRHRIKYKKKKIKNPSIRPKRVRYRFFECIFRRCLYIKWIINFRKRKKKCIFKPSYSSGLVPRATATRIIIIRRA